MNSAVYTPRKRGPKKVTMSVGNDPPSLSGHEFKDLLDIFKARTTNNPDIKDVIDRTNVAQRLLTLLETVLSGPQAVPSLKRDQLSIDAEAPKKRGLPPKITPEEVSKKRDELLLELNRLDQLTKAVASYHPPNIDRDTQQEPPPKRIRRKRGGPSEFAMIMEEVLKDAGRPLNRFELVDEIERCGFPITSIDKPRYIGTIAWRQRKTFIHIVGHGYWLKHTPLPEIGYDPASLGKSLNKAHKIKL